MFQKLLFACLGVLVLLTPVFAEDMGRINVVTDVNDAEIYINGQYVGKNAVNNYPLAAGSHYVQVKYENKVRYAEKVFIQPGQLKTITSENFVDLRTQTANRGAIDREAKRLRDTKGYMAFGIHGGSPASGLSFKWWVFDRLGLQLIGFTQNTNATDKNTQVAARLLIGFADKVFNSQALSSYFALGAGSFEIANTSESYTGSLVDVAFGLEAELFNFFWSLELGLYKQNRTYQYGTGVADPSSGSVRGEVHYYF